MNVAPLFVSTISVPVPSSLTVTLMLLGSPVSSVIPFTSAEPSVMDSVIVYSYVPGFVNSISLKYAATPSAADVTVAGVGIGAPSVTAASVNVNLPVISVVLLPLGTMFFVTGILAVIGAAS